MSAAASEMCRVTVVWGDRSVDLALPVDLVLADLLPVALGHVREELGDAAAGRGVVVQRLGQPVLDESLTPQQLGLRDGDVLHVRPVDEPLPPASVDDLVAGVAERVAGRPGRWSPTLTRQLGRGVFVGSLALGAALLTRDGPLTARVVLAAAVTVLLIAGAAFCCRRHADRTTAALLGLVGVGYGALATTLALGPVTDSGPASGWSDPALLLWGASGALAVSVVARLVSDAVPAVFLATGTLAGLAGVGLALLVVTSLSAVHVAVVVMIVVLLLSPHIPTVAFRLAGLRVPDVPMTAEDVTRDVEPVPDGDVTPRSADADRYTSALYVVLGAVAMVGVTPLALASGWAPPLFAALVSALLLLRYRTLDSAWQRLAVAVPAGYGVVLLVWRVGGALDPPVLLGVVFTALVGLGVGLLAGTRLLSERPVRPYWGRAAELGESLFAANLVPIGLAVLGVYEIALRLLG